MPFWNPWYCGGNVLWQNPQVSLISPVYLMALVMPLALAMKINVVIHYVIGCVGMHLLLRRVIGVTSPAVVVALVAVSAFSGGVALHLAAGHSNYLSVLWLPGLVYCFFRACDGHVRSIIAGGAIVGVSVLNAAPHFVPLAAVVLGTLALVAVAVARTFKPLAIAVVIVAAGCVYAAPKLVPAASFARSDAFHDRRPTKHPDSMSFEMFQRALWDSSQTKTLKISPGIQLYAWHEYGNYMGWFGAALSLMAAVWILVFRWRAASWGEMSCAVGLFVMLLIAAGEFAAWAPATLLHELPLFASFRIPSRHIMLASILGPACIAYVVRASSEMTWSRLTRGIVTVVCVIGTAQLMVVNRRNLHGIFALPPSPVEARHLDKSAPVIAEHEPPSVQWSRLGENSVMLPSMAAGVSVLNCYEPLLARRIVPPGPAVIRAVGDVKLSDPTFSMNRVTVGAAAGPEPVRLVLNQNFAEGWSSGAGPVERDPSSGLPSVLLPAGFTGTVDFTFAPHGLVFGFAIWLIAVAVSVVVWRRAASSSAAQA
ncbi:MAG TPA: hypothetical protein VN700_00940 [Vicinamibacterales bacterium]|nr:hypothetical protein [Vicinamibacterales bacterium]